MKNLNRHLVAAASSCSLLYCFSAIRRSASSREEETLREDNAAEVPTPPESSLAGAPEPTEQQMMEQVAQAKRDDALRYSREELSTARHFMNRDGARAKITLKIIDQEGAPGWSYHKGILYPTGRIVQFSTCRRCERWERIVHDGEADKVPMPMEISKKVSMKRRGGMSGRVSSRWRPIAPNAGNRGIQPSRKVRRCATQ